MHAGDAGKVCPRIRSWIHEGIKECAEKLHYSDWKDCKDGFVCSNKSCNHVAIPYEEDSSKATSLFSFLFVDDLQYHGFN